MSNRESVFLRLTKKVVKILTGLCLNCALQRNRNIFKCYLFIWNSSRETDRFFFCLMGHFSDDCNSQSWDRLKKPAARSFNRFSNVVHYGTKTWIICCFSLAIKRELDQKWSSQDINLNPYANAAGNVYAHYTTILTLAWEFNYWM